MTGIVNDLSIFVSFVVGLESPTYSLFQGLKPEMLKLVQHDEICYTYLLTYLPTYFLTYVISFVVGLESPTYSSNKL